MGIKEGIYFQFITSKFSVDFQYLLRTFSAVSNSLDFLLSHYTESTTLRPQQTLIRLKLVGPQKKLLNICHLASFVSQLKFFNITFLPTCEPFDQFAIPTLSYFDKKTLNFSHFVLFELLQDVTIYFFVPLHFYFYYVSSCVP